jgi:hypothetical protein
MAYFLKLNKKKWFVISQFRKEKKKKRRGRMYYLCNDHENIPNKIS